MLINSLTFPYCYQRWHLTVRNSWIFHLQEEQSVVGMLEPLMEGIVDHVIGLTRSRQILYVVVGLSFGFVFERPFELHVCKMYLKWLK